MEMLQQNGGAAENLNVSVGNNVEHLALAHAHKGDEHTKHSTQHHSHRRDPQRTHKAGEEHTIVFYPQLYYLFHKLGLLKNIFSLQQTLKEGPVFSVCTANYPLVGLVALFDAKLACILGILIEPLYQLTGLQQLIDALVDNCHQALGAFLAGGDAGGVHLGINIKEEIRDCQTAVCLSVEAGRTGGADANVSLALGDSQIAVSHSGDKLELLAFGHILVVDGLLNGAGLGDDNRILQSFNAGVLVHILSAAEEAVFVFG